MQRRINNTVVCLVTVFIVLAVAVVSILLLRYDTSSNSTISDSSSSSGSAIQQFNNTSLLDNDASITYPWTLTGDSSNKTDDTNNDEITNYHDGPISDFISITDIAQDITPVISTRSSNQCTADSKSLMRFTLTTDNYPVSRCNCVV